MWIGALLRPDEWSQVWRWVCLILLPVLVIAVAFGMYHLLILMWERKSRLSVLLVVLCLGGIIFFGEYYPGNSMLLLVEAIAVICLSKSLYETQKSDCIRIDAVVHCNQMVAGMQLWADRKIQVLPNRRGDSSPFVLF